MCDEPESTKSNLDLSLVGGLATKRTGFAPPCEGGVLSLARLGHRALASCFFTH